MRGSGQCVGRSPKPDPGRPTTRAGFFIEGSASYLLRSGSGRFDHPAAAGRRGQLTPRTKTETSAPGVQPKVVDAVGTFDRRLRPDSQEHERFVAIVVQPMEDTPRHEHRATSLDVEGAAADPGIGVAGMARVIEALLPNSFACSSRAERSR